jgi:hypothetical protein
MIVTFLAGFLGVIFGVITTGVLFYLLYRQEKKTAQEFSDKFLDLLAGDLAPTSKKSKKVDFLSLIKNDKDDTFN